MMVADSLLLPCRRTCSAAYPHHALHNIRRSCPACRCLASNASGLQPLAHSQTSWLLVQQSRLVAEVRGQSRAKAEGKTKGCGTCVPLTSVCTWGRNGTAFLVRRAVYGRQCLPVLALQRASYARPRPGLTRVQS